MRFERKQENVMNQTQTHGRAAQLSGPEKTSAGIMSEAQAAVDVTNSRAVAFTDWHKTSGAQTKNSGPVACWKDGLILTMQVCEASFASQKCLEAAFNDSLALVKSNRELLSRITVSGGSADGLNEIIAEAESDVRRLADTLSREHQRGESFLVKCEQLATLMADWYNLPRHAIYQLDHCLLPDFFDDVHMNEFDAEFDPDVDPESGTD